MIHFLKGKIHGLISDKKFSEILTGSVWALSARVLAACLGLISTIIIARFYGAEVMGIVAVVNSFLVLVTIFTVLGTNTSILRLIPEHLLKYSPTSAFKVYRKTQYMVIGVSLFTGTLFFFGANLIAEKIFSKPRLSFYLALAAMFVVFKSLMVLNTQAVRGLRLIRVFALMQTLPQGFNLLLLLLLGMLVSTMDVPIYALLGGCAMTAIAGWSIMEYTFKKKVEPYDQVKILPAWKILSLSLPMLITATMTFAVGQTGVIMLGMFRSEAEVGYYAVAVRLATLTSVVLSAINSIAAPKFSELFHSGRMDELFYVAKKSTKLIFWTTTPILLSLILLGRTVLSYGFGSNFTVAYSALVFLVVGQFVHAVSGSCGYFMNMTGNQKAVRNIVAGGSVINILSNLLLIPTFGIVGAAISSMLSLSIINLSILMYIKIQYGRTIGYFPSI